MSNLLTTEQFKQVLPTRLKKTVNQELIDKINATISDPYMVETLRDNILGYVNVLQDGRFKIEDYISAVKYCSYKLMGDTNIKAYTKTFPDRYQRMVTEGVSTKDINSYVTSYNKNKLVIMIMEQSLVPSHVMNQDLYQKALNVQAELMVSAKSEKVRCDAANSLLTQLKLPETKKIELDIGVKEGSIIDDLRQATLALAAEQRKMLEAGAMNTKEIAHSKIIEVASEDGITYE